MAYFHLLSSRLEASPHLPVYKKMAVSKENNASPKKMKTGW